MTCLPCLLIAERVVFRKRKILVILKKKKTIAMYKCRTAILKIKGGIVRWLERTSIYMSLFSTVRILLKFLEKLKL